MNIPLVRLLNQQIISQQYARPEDLVDWMGAVQAQDLKAALWAVGLRLKNGRKSKVEAALDVGKIIRTHVMRPTWQFVSPEDVRWMLELNREPMEKMYAGYLKSTGVIIGEKEYGKALEVFSRVLEGGKSLTLEGLRAACEGVEGISPELHHVKGYIVRAESRALLCNGVPEGSKNTYSLMDEKVPLAPCISRDEAVAKLACKYFRSHSPATLQDFVWWSGLGISEARKAMEIISANLEKVVVKGREFFIHSSCRTRGRLACTATLLPAYDEYLLGYKDRSDVIPEEFYPKAFNNFGIFHRVIQQGGQLVGNWDARPSAKGPGFSVSFFRSATSPLPPSSSANEPSPALANANKQVSPSVSEPALANAFACYRDYLK